MTIAKVKFSYLEKHFQNDMNLRGFSGKFDRSFPGTGPYKDGEDFFKYFWQAEKDNLYQKEQDKFENEYIISNKMTKKIELINNNFDALITLTFKNENDAKIFRDRDCGNNGRIEQILSKENLCTVVTNEGRQIKKYRTPTKYIIGWYGELLNQYFVYSRYDDSFPLF